MTKQQEKTVYVVTDDKDVIHRLESNIIGQKVYTVSSAGRTIVWAILFIAGVKYIWQMTNWILSVVLTILLFIILQQLIFKVLVDKEEMKTMRPLKDGEKLTKK
jgi:uncharacterized membrane protein